MNELRSCPVCDSRGKRHVLYHQRFCEGVLGEGYNVVVCAACGAGFADGIPTQLELDRYYKEQSKYTYSVNRATESIYDLRRFEIIAEQIASSLSVNARILDIGCATGGLLSVFKRRGFVNITGADPSPDCAVAAKRLHGVDVLVATFSELSQWTERFDLVLMVGVLEHLRDVGSAVRIAAQLLTPSGLLLCAVPDVEALSECRNAPYQQFSMEHVNFFSGQSLRAVFGSCGLSEIQSMHYFVEWRHNITEPILSGCFQIRKAYHLSEPDNVTEVALAKYIAFSREADARIKRKIDLLVESQVPLLVWGAGRDDTSLNS